MKKLTLTILLALCAVALTGCGDIRTPEQKQQATDADNARYITEFNYKGHRYLKYQRGAGRTRAVGITHDPDCPCREKGGKEQ